MSTEYRVTLADASGVKQAEIVDYLQLAYSKRLNEAGRCSLLLRGASPIISGLASDWQVTVWRRNIAQGLDWYADFSGLVRGQERRYTDRPRLTVTALGDLSLLSRRIIAYRAATSGRSAFTSTPAETLLKQLVTYNATSSGTTGDGRARNAALSGFTITVPSSSATGTLLDWRCVFKPLLKELQDIAASGGVDFRLDKTGASTWQFSTFVGTDRTATVVFALESGNMAEPVYTLDRTSEKTVCIVAGQGEEAARDVVVRTSADYSAANDHETFQDARNEKTTAELNSAGDSALEDVRARQTFSFKVLQTPATFYGQHYCVNGALGDKVTARYDSVEATQEIVGITVDVKDDGKEQISVELRTI